METSRVVVDASFLLKLFFPEEDSDRAEARWKGWIDDSIEVVAPHLIAFEVVSVLRNKVSRGLVVESEAGKLVDILKSLDITFIFSEDILDEAWGIGVVLNTSNLYDCFYVGLSKILRVPLWTADKKLYNLARKKYPNIHLL